MVRKIELIGGPAAGRVVTIGTGKRIRVPIPPAPNHRGKDGSFTYEIRRFRTPAGNPVYFGISDEQPVTDDFLSERCLVREH
jgi:hypothetical protein